MDKLRHLRPDINQLEQMTMKVRHGFICDILSVEQDDPSPTTPQLKRSASDGQILEDAGENAVTIWLPKLDSHKRPLEADSERTAETTDESSAVSFAPSRPQSEDEDFCSRLQSELETADLVLWNGCFDEASAQAVKADNKHWGDHYERTRRMHVHPSPAVGQRDEHQPPRFLPAGHAMDVPFSNEMSFAGSIQGELDVAGTEMRRPWPPLQLDKITAFSSWQPLGTWTQANFSPPEGNLLDPRQVRGACKALTRHDQAAGYIGEETLLSMVPLNDEGERASLGSLKHPDRCSPCIFWFRDVCTRGVQCEYCHFRHQGQKKKRIRPSKNTRMQMRLHMNMG
eukprot:TRINITY_DN6474_c0_g1_i3.p1 TRINITY_DN6474_c0_g1~~TRINITY_DN6474_c0_g1_i3.p1  ORF type:complete len:341 (+),score=53.46 TRINITY_DN6474_c0_g1_i3:89-1111(+)